ncbi:MAG: hypothetical protein ACTSQI_12520 [Candidatus Helarchaeota archaeon]
MSYLKSLLATNELVIDRVTPIEVEGDAFDCAVTNLRTILYKKGGKQFIEIEHETIDQISLQKEWYNEFFLGASISLILGLIWAIAGYVYRFINDPTIQPQIGIIRALFYPGLVLICLGTVGLFFYFTRMKIHVLIITSEKTFELYSKQDRLDELLLIHEQIKSGVLLSSKGRPAELSDTQRNTEKPLFSFANINGKITFKDDTFQKKSIHLKFKIDFTNNYMQLVSNRLLALEKSPVYTKVTKGITFPLITEENLCDIFKISKTLPINWIWLTRFNFALPKISIVKEHFLTGPVGPTSLLLKVEPLYGQFTLELSKSQLFSSEPAEEIIHIKKIIKNYETDPVKLS